MRWLIAFLALAGMVAAALALREHYRTEASPCSINEKWDCGTVNKSRFAVIGGVPVAVIGIAGYLLLAGLAIGRRWRLLAAAASAFPMRSYRATVFVRFGSTCTAKGSAPSCSRGSTS